MKQDDFSVYPSPFFAGLVTSRFYATWDFYTERLGFRTVSEGGGSVRLLHPCGAQLVLIQEESGQTPAELVSAVEGRGFWLTLEVADVAAERLDLMAAGVPVQSLPGAACWPRDSFAVSDPNGVLVVIMPRSVRARCSVAAVA
ncbi:MAG: VOC family protein [Opitutaceae bacterium]|nr:VOC family protein [Opitutaceae bacterium]